MRFGILALALVGLAFVAFETSTALAADQTHSGTIVSVNGAKLTMADANENEATFTVDETAKITLDGKPAKLQDLKKGQAVKVTTQKSNGETVAVKIEAKSAK